MLLFVVASLLVPLAAASGEGNLHLLEEEIAQALKNCASRPGHSAVRTRRDVTGQYNNNHQRNNNDNGHDNGNSHNNGNGQNNGNGNNNNEDSNSNNKQNGTPNNKDNYGMNSNSSSIRIDNATQADNSYGHERRNISELRINALNDSQPQTKDSEFGRGNPTGFVRNKRGGGLLAVRDSDQCLSQCVFANLQVVDIHGIPREPELWGKVQTSVTSQQSRNALKDQIHACFQELEQEAEDDGCSYSNKLERCLTLRLEDRTTQATTSRAPGRGSHDN